MDASRPSAPLLLFLLTLLLPLHTTCAASDIENVSPYRHKRAAVGISLTFVFDSTGSMSDELSQVKQAMQEIFDFMKVNRSNEIQNFVLVEFNDPYAKLLTVTSDAKEYQKNLNNIKVNGGGDCPEMAMKGLKLALEASLPNSYLFVFTDASAKDYTNQAEVENLIQRKKSKVVFVLTGKCNGESDPGYQAYKNIARVSNGHVFNLLRKEVTKVLEFVKLDTKRKSVIKAGEISGEKTFKTSVDPSMTEMTVTVTGRGAKIDLKDPTGKKEDGTTILDLEAVKAKQVKNPIPGNWTVDVRTTLPGRFVIMTESSFNFAYGFSLEPTDNIEETAPRPLIGRETALLIKVTNHSNHIRLIDVKIKDAKENILKKMSLHPIRGKSDTYKADMFLPPTSVFFLEVSGKDSMNNEIIRISDSGISPQSPGVPIITLKPEVTATLKFPYSLSCHVESLVPFTGSWLKGDESVVPDKQFLQSGKIFYNISKVDMFSGGIYTCKATNVAGSSSKDVTLNVQVPPPFVKTPKKLELQANQMGEIPCEVDSDIDFMVTWSKMESSGSVPVNSGRKFTIKPTGNLIISTVEKSDEGEYICTAKSVFGTGESRTLVEITEPVQVVVVPDKLNFRSQQNYKITCSASGSEPLTLEWKRNGITIKDSDKRLQRPNSKQLELKIQFAQESDAGTYECEASNKINKASQRIELKYMERIKVKILPSFAPPLAGTQYTLVCLVTGSPKPIISWTKDGMEILPKDFEQILPNGTLIIPRLSFNHSGDYQCIAENEFGKVATKVIVDVVSGPHFDSNREEIYVEIYGNVSLICNVHGQPEPNIKWERKDGEAISERFARLSSCSMFLTEAHPEDGGTYVVTASNKYGIQKKHFEVHITGLVKPILAKGSPEEVSIVGKQKELTCIIEGGNPPPTLIWYKDGEILETDDLLEIEGKVFANGSLIFSYIKPDNEGTYVCEASNVAGKTERRLNLKVHEAPIFIDDNRVVLKARFGTAVPLTCEAYGNPKPKITWKKNNKPIVFSHSMTLNSRGDSLLIMSTTFENNGTYECVAVNSAGSNKKIIDLLVQDAPRIFPPSTTEIFIENGEEITLPCEVQAYPPAKIKWFKNGSPHETGSINYSPNNSSLRLTADLSSSGEYSCLATNEAGHDQIAINITVTVAPHFKDMEEHIQASRGDSVTLSCYTDAVPPAHYYWLKYPDTEPIVGDSMMIFDNVDDSYTGLYRCEASNIAGNAQKIFILKIYVPPLIVAELPKTQFLKKGASFSIPCYATGEPIPKIHWLKNGKPLLSLESDVLEIKSATEEDAGIYTCVAENYEGSDEKNMEVFVEAHPSMDGEYSKDIEVNESSPIILSCPAISGIPLPTVQWLKDEVPIIPTRRVSPKDKHRSLNIKRAKLNDEGKYTCVASNTVGEARADMHLTVLTAPIFLNGSTKVDINKLTGTTLLLDCANTGKPIPEVTWFRNNRPLLPHINPRIKITSNQVIIEKSNPGDQAVYKCVVQNKAGRIERSFNIKIFVYGEDEGDISTEGEWGPWSPWSSCTASCGESYRGRFRTCSDEKTSSCKGPSEEWHQCFAGDCKVDGNWGQWGNWSTCSVTCGSGVRFRERLCNNPIPQYGGKICFGANRQHESCNTQPCPVDGEWSTWTVWEVCSGPCSNSSTKRTRKCTNPTPAFGGKMCSGPKVEYKSCTQEKCPVHGGWSEWGPWSSCSATCGHSVSFRERSCNNPKPKLNGAFCSGPSREKRKCPTEVCDKIPLHALVTIKGNLNGHNITETTAHVNITDMSAERLVEARSTKPFKRKRSAEWYPYLSLVISPITWLTAFQKEDAINGFTLTKGVFEMQTFIKFTSGEEVLITHVGEGLGSEEDLIIKADIQGKTPQFPSGSAVAIKPYQEDYIQSGLGELFVSSSNTIEGGGISIPYFWNKTIKYNADLGKQPTFVETLTVQNIKLKRLKQKEEGHISTKSARTCPKGFELLSAGYCQDIDECSNRHWQNCHFTQTCVNHKGSYACMCPPGFKASAKGGKCTDVNECDESICSHKCVNLEGSFKCLCPPGWALLDSKTTCSSILPIKLTKEGEIEDWKHCMPKQIEVDGVCQDENPCEDNTHMCGEGALCVPMHGFYRCIPVPCPNNFERLKGTKSCIKYCTKYKCDSGAIISETLLPIILTPGGPIAPYKDLVYLPLNIEKTQLAHTVYKIVKNEKGKPFRVKSVDGMGTLYSTKLLPTGEEYRVFIQATTYDASNTDILYNNQFTVIIHSLAD